VFQGPEGLHRHLVKSPGEHQDADGESDLPCQRCPGPPPDEGKGQGAYAANGNNDERGSEIPLHFIFRGPGPEGAIQELSAMLAFDGLILNVFGAIWALLHTDLPWIRVFILRG
jgi:hypothetical protein